VSWTEVGLKFLGFAGDDLMPLFRTRLRVLRAEREWSQAKLAAQVGVTRQTINSIEKGRFHPNLRLAFKIARAFGKQIAEVFTSMPAGLLL
jgi:putative transcriptional regulator